MKPEQNLDGGCEAQPYPSVLPRQELPAVQGSPPTRSPCRPTCLVAVKHRPQLEAQGEQLPRVPGSSCSKQGSEIRPVFKINSLP